MKDTPDTDEAEELDPRQAAAIVLEARERALHELRTSFPLLFTVWGLVLLVGYGVIWLSVRGQHPYKGPTGGALAILTLVVAAGAVVTMIVAGRAFTGVGGASAAQRRVHYLALLAGYVGVFTLEGALANAGASLSLVDIYGATAPLIVVGVVYAASPAVWQDWSTRALGGWLILVAGGAAYAGPVGVWGVTGLAGSVGFWVLAAVRRGRDRA